MKCCPGCGVTKSLDDFWIRSNGKPLWRCKECLSPQKPKNRMYKRAGVTATQYHALLSLQHGVCFFCGAEPKTKRLAVDHDHATGKVRGLLCPPCNSSLGLLEKHWNRIHYYLNARRQKSVADTLAGSTKRVYYQGKKNDIIWATRSN